MVRKTMVAMALAAFSVGTVYAQTSGSTGGQGGGSTASTSTFQDWLNSHSAKSGGRITRQAYMEEAGRRWDAMDKTKQGLTAAEIRGMYNPPAVMGGPTATSPQDKAGVKQ